MNLTRIQTSFEYGEISPRLLGRIDVPAYSKGVKIQENSYTYIHGGATKRRGTLFVGEVKNSAQTARLIPFVYSVTQRYMLVLNGGVLQFLKDGEFIESSPGVRYELASPYPESALKDIRFAQSGNTMYLVHQDYPPQILQRITDTSWTFSNISFTYNAVSDVTFSNGYITFKIINGGTVFAKDQQFTITTVAGAVTATSGFSGGVAPLGTGTVAAVASQPGSTTSETWTIKCTLSTPSRQEWSVVGSVSGSPACYWRPNNYPKAITFFEQRLYFAGSPQFPQHIWGSAAGDYLNMTVGNKDADAVIVQIAGNDYSAIEHLSATRWLMPLTTSTEYSLAGPNSSAISGTNSNIIRDHTRQGSNHVKPARIGKEVLFVQRDGKKVRASSYSSTEDANVAPDISLFAEHMTRTTTITDMAYATTPDSVNWVIRSDGVLLSLVLSRDHDTTAWSRHITDGLFEAVGTVPSIAADDVYFIIKRTVNGSQKRYVEIFDYDESDVAYMDSTVVYDGAATATITGLNHLIGKTVTIVADGVVHPNRVVSNTGTILLDRPASFALVGLPFTTTLSMLNPEFGDANSSSSSQGKTVSVIDVIIKFESTVNAKVGGTVIPFRTTTMGLDSTIEPFTGNKSIKSLTGWNIETNLTLTSDTPTPFTVLAVIVKAAVN